MIHVHGIAHQFRNPGGFVVERMEGSGDYLLLFLRSAAEFDPGIGYVPVSEVHYILFRKDCPQKYRKLDGMFINDWMHFDFDSYDSYFENLGIPFNTPLALPDNKPIFDLFMDIYSEFFNDGVQHEFIMDHKANALFHKFSDLYVPQPADPEFFQQIFRDTGRYPPADPGIPLHPFLSGRSS